MALLLPALPPSSAELNEALRSPGKPGVTYEWWNAEWHFRVPVILRPRLPDELTRGPGEGPVFADIPGVKNFPVRLEIDFTDAVRRVGEGGTTPPWPRDNLGRLSSFTFDTKSVRVVAQDYDSGRVLASVGNAGLLPSTLYTGLLENPGGRNAVFNASSNAVGTVLFQIPGTWSSQLLVFVYFDILENGGPKPATSWSEPQQAWLDSLHWVRTGTTFLGQMPKRARDGDPAPGLGVFALYPNTTVRIQKLLGPGVEPETIARCKPDTSPPEPVPCVLGGTVSVTTGSELPVINPGFGPNLAGATVYVSPYGETLNFRVDATKPALVALVTMDVQPDDINSIWYPSIDGNLLGTEFLFPGLGMTWVCSQCNPPHEPNTLRIVAPQAKASVTVTTPNPNGPGLASYTCTVERGRSMTIETCTGNQVGYEFQRVYGISSPGAPIAVVSTGASTEHGLQGITAYGAPTGKVLTVPIAELSVVAAWEPSQVFIFNYDKTSERIPITGTQTVTATGADRSWSYLQSDHRLRGELWAVSATGESTLVGGMVGQWAFGGKAATEFVVPLYRPNANTAGPSGLIVPLYDDTRVEVVRLDTGEKLLSRTLGLGDFFVRRPSDELPILSARDVGKATVYRVTATKPIALYGMQEPGFGAYANWLPAKTATPDHEVGAVEFFGCLVGWNAKDKTQSGTFKPGDVARFEFRAANLGTAAGGAATEDSVVIARSVTGGTTDWKVSLSSTFLKDVPTGEEKLVVLTIDIPSTASTGDTLVVELKAQSACNPLIGDTASARLTVQTKYDLDMRFVSNNRKEITRTIKSTGNDTTLVSLPITISNAGSGADRAEFSTISALGSLYGFRSRLLDENQTDLVTPEGRPKGALGLGVGVSRVVTLLVEVPSIRGSIPPVVFTIGAESTLDRAANDQVSATLLLNAETAIRIEAENATLPVAPGRDAVFNLTVVNLGVEAEIELESVAALGRYPGWNVSLNATRFVLRSAGSGGDRQLVNLTVRAADKAEVGTVLSTKVLARALTEAAGGSPEASVILTSRVGNSFLLDLPENLPPQPAFPGQRLRVDLPTASRANGVLLAEIVPSSLPPGWRLADRLPPGRFGMEPDEARILSVGIDVRPNERPGPYAVTLGILLEDEGTGDRVVKDFLIPVEVRAVVDLELGFPRDLQVPPGGTVRVPVLVRNVGNENATPTLAVTPPSGWASPTFDNPVDWGSDKELPPGGARLANFTVRAPAGAKDAATLRVRADLDPYDDEVADVPLGILRRDLQVVSVAAVTESIRVGRTAVVDVSVRNNGTLAAAEVDVVLLVDGAVAANVTLGSLPAGETRTFPLPWTATTATQITVAVDPREKHADENRANNAVTIDVGDRVSGTFAGIFDVPAPSPLLALALALGLALAGRRRR